MEVKVPYINPIAFLETLRNHYKFSQSAAWNSAQIVAPTEIANGGLLLFRSNDLHFIRGQWTFNEASNFISDDPVGKKGLVDFRIDKSGHLSSARMQGEKRFEWDITEVDGFRFFVPEKYLAINNKHVSDSFRAFCEHPNIRNLLKQIINISPLDTEKAMLLESKMLEFLHYWLTFQKTFEIDSFFEIVPDKTQFIIQNAKQIIQENIHQSISVKEISRKVGMNEFDLKRNFKKLVGLPIHQYLIKQKLDQARQQVLYTDLPISDICSNLGYTNRGHFANLYQRYFGLTPLHDRLNQCL